MWVLLEPKFSTFFNWAVTESHNNTTFILNIFSKILYSVFHYYYMAPLYFGIIRYLNIWSITGIIPVYETVGIYHKPLRVVLRVAGINALRAFSNLISPSDDINLQAKILVRRVYRFNNKNGTRTNYYQRACFVLSGCIVYIYMYT